jgi:amidase
MDIDLSACGAAEMARAVEAGTISSRELLEAQIEIIERDDGAVNSVAWLDKESARASANKVDRARSAGRNQGPLAGVPFTVKESFDVAGCASTWGLPSRKDHRARRDARVVQQLKDAGAILIGKTNIPTMLADVQTNNELFGRTNNPWNLGRTSGGSSGGGAAAVAAGISPLDIGSDVGGSIRIPSSFCGVYGHKPTWGICSYEGHGFNHTGPLDIAVVGPIARCVEDIALSLEIMLGVPLPQISSEIGSLHIAVMQSDPKFDVDREIQAGIVEVCKFLSKRVAEVRDARPPISSEEITELFERLVHAALSIRLSDEQLALAASMATAGGTFPERIARARTMSHHEWLRANERRCIIKAAWDEFFGRHDLLICPVFATTAFAHDDSAPVWARALTINGSECAIPDQMFWVAMAGLVHLPSTVVPIGLSAEGLPIGIQIIGPVNADGLCLRLAGLLEEQFYAFKAPATSRHPDREKSVVRQGPGSI